MSHKRKILLFKSCLLVTYQPFVFYTYIFLIHKIHHKISTARNPDKHQPVVCEQDNFLTDRGSTMRDGPGDDLFSALALAFLSHPAPSGAAAAGGPCWVTQLAPPSAMTVPGLHRQRIRPRSPSTDLRLLLHQSRQKYGMRSEGQRGGKRGGSGSNFGTPLCGSALL